MKDTIDNLGRRVIDRTADESAPAINEDDVPVMDSGELAPLFVDSDEETTTEEGEE